MPLRRSLVVVSLTLLTGAGVAAWAPPPSRWPHSLAPTTTTRRITISPRQHQRVSLLAEEGKKGFGGKKAVAPPNKKKGKKGGGGAPAPIARGGGQQPLRLAKDSEDFPEVSERSVAALAEMEQRSQSRGDDVQRKIEDLEEVQATLQENPTAGVIPDVVAKRMLFRMLPLAAVPIFGGLALFVFFYLGATKGDFEVPPTIVAYATTAPWLLGLAGLTYGLISTSWDEDVEGSFLGVDEFQTNVARIFDGIKRGGENEELREIQRKDGR
jgi:hypothetical protein